MDKSGRRRDYQSVYLRRSFREDGKVKHEQLANLSALPEPAIGAIEAILKGTALVPAGDAVRIDSSLPHGHVAAAAAMAHRLGLPALLGPACRQRDLAYALILSRALRPSPKLSTAAWWTDTTLGEDLDVTGAGTDEIYAAMDWLVDRQDHIEKQLAAQHLDPKVNPSRIAMFDLSSSWVTGRHCDLAARGYSRDGKKGREQIEYGLLTDPAGRPVAVRVFPGNTADPAAFTHAVTAVKDTFALENMLMVGDRGMITSARITALKELGGLGWVTALRAPQIAALAADDGPLQMSLFDTQNFAEISHPDYPGERLIVCRNPALADERARKRTELLNATETAEAALDGIYTLRTTATPDELDTAAVIDAYKNLSRVERDFRSLKAIDLDLRPIHHRLTDRVKAHVLICMLAAYLTWHLRKEWAPLTYTDENPPHRDDPVAPAARSAAANSKAARKTTTDGDLPARAYQDLLAHLATLTRNQVHFTGLDTTVPMLAEPTDTQRRAFELLDTTVPLTIT
ncbi:MAG: transposase [Rhodococcus sp. (in: high G+C Gram-positive bacteria)]|nr:MAG: transposase [Rhodococcus sp. (in: high G+C Gram-positive bacteria)]